MSRVRRAFLMSSAEQYLTLIINFAMIAVMARLLTPSQIGLAIVGMGLSATIFSLREFATPEFLIQRRQIGRDDIRTAFTMIMAVTLVLAAGLSLSVGSIGRFYNEPGLSPFLTLLLIAIIVESTTLPSIALLRRDMNFGALARIRTSASMLTAATTVALAWLGHGHMSYAWGLLAGACTTMFLVLATRPNPEHFRPSLAAWRDVFSFGRYRGATGVIDKAYETIPQLLLGRIMPMSAVGFYNRANAICGIPDRILLSSVFAVAFPALAEQVRNGHDIKTSYLKVLSYISVVYWSALVVLTITADTVVQITLGDNWSEVVPVVRLLSMAALFWFPVIPTNPLLLAMGRNRDAFVASLIARSVAAIILCTASFYGIIALAASQFLALPFQMIVALLYARKHVGFTWRELFNTLRPSALVTLCASAGPLVILIADSGPGLPIPLFLLACMLAALGWLGGLVLTKHPFLKELAQPLRAIRTMLPARVHRPSGTPAE